MNISKTKKIFFWIFIVIFLYTFVELVCAVYIKIFVIRTFSTGHPDKLWAYDKKLDFKLKPNFHGNFIARPYRKIGINISSLGFRDYDFKLTKDTGVYRILIVGDSITFGAGVKLEDTYVKQTEKLLRHSNAKHYQVINAAVSYYHFEHYYIFIKDNTDRFNPGHIVIGFCINDVRPKDIVSPRYIVRERLKPQITSSLKHDIKKLIKKSPSFQLLSYLIFSNMNNRKKYNTRWITSVMMSWNKEGLVEKLIDMLEEIKRLTEERDIKLSVIIFPEMNQLVDYHKYGGPREKLLTILNDLNISYLDLYDTFQQKEDFSQYYLKGDTVHFTSDGHKIIAEELKNFLIE